MNRPPDDHDQLSPAEQRLHEHLEVLRQDAPQASDATVSRIVRSARWQQAIRRPLLAIVSLTATIGHALRLLIKPPAGRP